MGDGDGEGDVVRMGDGHGEEKGEFWADEKWTREERRSGLPEQDRDPVVVAVATGFNIFTFGSPFWATPFACNPTPLIILLQDGALRIFRRRSLCFELLYYELMIRLLIWKKFVNTST